MPFVRTHGNQITIVQSERDKATGAVQQRTLFTLYSKKEAQAAIGESSPEDCHQFQFLLADANPHLKFNWDKLNEEIRQRMEVLPDIYPLRKARSDDEFEKALDQFVRQVVACDPYLDVAHETLTKYRDDLQVLQNLVGKRLHALDRPRHRSESSIFRQDDKFCWRHELASNDVPIEMEEYACGFYDSGNYDEAKRIFSLLVRCFPGYAEGHNYLGLIALYQFSAKDAVEHFRATVKTGRNLFPSRVAKSAYWSDLNTRPYMRGLGNLAIALNQTEQYREALAICEKLAKECGDRGKQTACAHMSIAHLNLHNWQDSIDAALENSDFSPGEGFPIAFASFELGRYQEAIEWFLHAGLNDPHAAHILLEKKKPKPQTHGEAEDHNGGLMLLHSLKRYWRTQSKQSAKFFRKLIEHEEIKELLLEVIKCEQNHSSGRETGSRENFDRWHRLKSRAFAKAKAKELLVGFGLAELTAGATQKASNSAY